MLGISECLVKFLVEYSFEIDAQPYLLARRLDSSTFSLSATPRLGGIPIRQFVEQPRKLTPDGSPDLDVFAFMLADRGDSERFSVGQIVELES
jgi:hypothetical protein